jgi:CPA1 family monovalent cation:H+ antiporter
VVRVLWLLVTQHVPRWLHSRLGAEDIDEDVPVPTDQPLSSREIVALSWAGTRGVITLAAAFAIPLTIDGGTPFPGRDLLLFTAYLLVLATLLGQGLTFAPLLRWLGLRADLLDQVRLRNQARTAAVDAALARLDQLTEDEELPDRVVTELRQSLTARSRRYRERLAYLDENPETLRSPLYQTAVRVRRAIIDAQHEELLRWRDAGRLPDPGLRALQRELDHEERTLPMPPT